MAARKPRADEAVEAVEVMGIPIAIDPDVFDDLELMDMLADIEDGNALKVGRAMRVMFGEQWPAVMDALRDERGVVTVTRAVEFFVAAMEAVSAAKN